MTSEPTREFTLMSDAVHAPGNGDPSVGFHCLRQLLPTDCGPAVVASIAAHYGIRCSITSARDLCRGSAAKGASLLGVVKAFYALGLSASAVRGPSEILRQTVTPSIAVLRHGDRLHFVLLVDVADSGHVLVGDPAKGSVKPVSWQALEATWTGVVVRVSPPSKDSRANPACGLHLHSRFQVGVAFALTVAGTLGALVPSLYLQRVVDDHVMGTPGIPGLLTFYAAVLLGSRALAMAALELITARMALRCQLLLQRSLVERLLCMAPVEHRQYDVGDLMPLLNQVQSVRYLLIDATIERTVQISLALGAIIAMCVYDPMLGVYGALVVPAFAMAWCWELPVLGRLRREVMDATIRLGSVFADVVRSLATIKVYGAVGQYAALLGDVVWRLQRALYRVRVMSALRRVILALLASGMVVALVYAAAARILDDRLTVGGLAGYFGLLGLLIGPLERLSESLASAQEGRVAVDELDRVFDSDPSPDRGSHEGTVRGSITFEAVSFAYPGSLREVLHDVSFEVPEGSLVAVVGPSGSGKSTLLSLMLRLYNPTKGRVLLDGVSAAAWESNCLRDAIAAVFQDPVVLTESTIRDNVVMGRSQFRDLDVLRACRLAGVDGIVARLPKGLETIVARDGIALSGGERQRIALARALLGDPQILLLDEATSALDEDNARLVEAAIERIHGTGTVVVATHRLEILERCDVVVALEGGTVVFCGTSDAFAQVRGREEYRATVRKRPQFESPKELTNDA